MYNYNKEYTLRNGDTLIMRTPNESDAQGCIDLMTTADNETRFLGREPGEFNMTLDEEKEFLSNLNRDDTSRFLIAEIEGEVVGSCNVGLVFNKRRYCHRASMALLIKRDHWNKGIGKTMMEECLEWCKGRNIEQLELEVVKDNTRAISLYMKYGFEVQGVKKHALKYGDGTYGDEYNMCLFI